MDRMRDHWSFEFHSKMSLNSIFGKCDVPQVGYCTNVHAGRDLPSILRNIDQYSVPIRQMVDPERPMGVGLWFSEESAKQALDGQNLVALELALSKNQLVPFTLNGFPQGDFHREIVKHDVYLPTWWTEQRLEYTRNLVQILDRILPSGQVGSISTLPIAWGSPKPSDDQMEQAASNLLTLARELRHRFETTGRRILIAIEPEPGCCLTDSRSFRGFYNRYFSAPRLSERDAMCAREFLTICHDVCHAAVMFEDQQEEFRLLRHDGIAIGKVQVSSAIELDWDGLDVAGRRVAMDQLRKFAEDRYLHQTTWVEPSSTSSARSVSLTEDLPTALGSIAALERLHGKWRVHFHVPIYLDRFESLSSTRGEILRCVDLLSKPGEESPSFSGHFEIETYAWGVLPAELREDSLQRGIAKEFCWFQSLLSTCR